MSRGFDSDELVALGSRKSVELLIQIAQKSPKLDNEIFGFHVRAYLDILTKTAQHKPSKSSPLHRVRKVTFKQVQRLSNELQKMDLFQSNDKSATKFAKNNSAAQILDPDLAKMLEEFKRAEGGMRKGGALSDVEDHSDGDWDNLEYRAGNPLDHFDDSDFEYWEHEDEDQLEYNESGSEDGESSLQRR